MDRASEGFGSPRTRANSGSSVRVKSYEEAASDADFDDLDYGESPDNAALEAATLAQDLYRGFLDDHFEAVYCASTAAGGEPRERAACGYVFDQICTKHAHPGGPHPERPARVLAIKKVLEITGLERRMKRIEARALTQREALEVHSKQHLERVQSLRDRRTRHLLKQDLASESAYANEHTTAAALFSAGGVLELVKAVCAGQVRCGLAIVRPPGHHAEEGCIKGFCLFNNVAVAAAWASRRVEESDWVGQESASTDGRGEDRASEDAASVRSARSAQSTGTRLSEHAPSRDALYHSIFAPERGLSRPSPSRDSARQADDRPRKSRRGARQFKPVPGQAKVLVVDFDVHHGNGTQKMFYEDGRVMFFSVHRFDHGRFYPGGPDGSPTCVGAGAGFGANINIGWNGAGAGDAEYLAAWQHVLMPAARHFAPDLVIVSAGFDAAQGDQLGGCQVTPAGYGAMLHQLMELADGRVVVALEGGYSLDALAQSSLVCAAVLLGKPPPRPMAAPRAPSQAALAAIGATVRAHRAAYWAATEDDDLDCADALAWAVHACDPSVPRELPAPGGAAHDSSAAPAFEMHSAQGQHDSEEVDIGDFDRIDRDYSPFAAGAGFPLGGLDAAPGGVEELHFP